MNKNIGRAEDLRGQKALDWRYGADFDFGPLESLGVFTVEHVQIIHQTVAAMS